MSKLLSPIAIGKVQFRNRIVMPPMVRLAPSMPRAVVDTGGCVTPAVLDHYGRRASAGTGFVIVEATAVDPQGRAWEQGLNAFSDDHIPHLARLADAIKAEGAVAGIQLVHAGPQGSPAVIGGDTVGPSAIPPASHKPTPRALTEGEIHQIEQRFAEAAVRAAEAGFDVVELHGAHGFLLDSFLLQSRNQRTDAYGGELDGRMRFLLETCAQVRAGIGYGTLLGCRVCVFNKLDGGFGHPELVQLVEGLVETGIDLLHVSTRAAFKTHFATGKTLGRLVKEITGLPIIVAGGLSRPEDAERLVAEGHADLAAVGRAMLKDPDWSRHAREKLQPGGATD